MAQLNHNLKAATLMESLIAMIIIVVCFGVATMIYTNVLDSDKQRLQLKAILILNKTAIESKAKNEFLDSEEQEGDWTINKTVEKYSGTENLYQLTLAVKDRNGKIIAVRNELILME